MKRLSGRVYGSTLLWLGFFLVLVATAARVYGEFVQRWRKHQGVALGMTVVILLDPQFECHAPFPPGMKDLVDSTVWIDFWNGRGAAHTRKLEHCIQNRDDICCCGFIVAEVLQGIRDWSQFSAARRQFENLIYLNRTEVVSGDQTQAMKNRREIAFSPPRNKGLRRFAQRGISGIPPTGSVSHRSSRRAKNNPRKER
jgi:hypothetical protein